MCAIVMVVVVVAFIVLVVAVDLLVLGMLCTTYYTVSVINTMTKFKQDS